MRNEIGFEREKLEELSAECLVEFVKAEGIISPIADDLERTLADERELERQKQAHEDWDEPFPQSLDERLSALEEEKDDQRLDLLSYVEAVLDEREAGRRRGHV